APPVRWHLAHVGWRHGDDWPPAESVAVDWFPDADGTLTPAPAATARTVDWTHDPADPVPGLAHAYHPLIEPVDESATADRADVVTFQTAPLVGAVDLAGPAELTARIESSGPSTHLMVRVADVAPDGYALRVLDGAVAVSGPFPATVTVDLGHTGYRLRPGHSLRMELSSSEFPRYVPHPGTADDPWTATT